VDVPANAVKVELSQFQYCAPLCFLIRK